MKKNLKYLRYIFLVPIIYILFAISIVLIDLKGLSYEQAFIEGLPCHENKKCFYNYKEIYKKYIPSVFYRKYAEQFIATKEQIEKLYPNPFIWVINQDALSYEEKIDTIRSFIKKGVSINIKSIDGYNQTVIYYILWKNDIFLDFFLKNGIDLGVKNYNNQTPSEYAYFLSNKIKSNISKGRHYMYSDYIEDTKFMSQNMQIIASILELHSKKVSVK